ncbi:helix-turn-helix domain-containing protein [Paenibacillus sp. NPDC058367]|uniref:helix-turn-helix domain-containing protein n=1 Tax=Paenibacillus sp. NPDC058367 TaxID=3346460 RepID=UPI0036583A9C
MDIKPRKLTDDQIELVMQLIYMDNEPMMIVNEEVREIGEILRIKRVADGMTLRQLGKLLKMTPGTLSEIENSKRTIPRGKEKAVEDYIYRQLYMNGSLEFRMTGDEDDDGEYTTL